MNKAKRGLRSESGQGIVEYILLLVVVITLAILLANRLFKPFREWAQHYIGNYVECLLDQGELPGLGGASGVQECNFTNPFEEGGSSNASKGGSSGSSEKERGVEERDNESEASKSDSKRSNLVAQAGGRQRSVRIGGFDNGGGGAKSIVVEEGGGSKERSPGYLRGGYGGGRNNDRARQIQVSGINGMLMAEREKIKKREDKIRKVAAVSEEGGGSKQGRKIEVREQLRKPRDVDLSGDGFSFGKIFRLLIIIVVAIAMILFIGGQLSQISKSMEK
ncbi:MAG: hypothetical protein KF681_11825 [Bdellovibrionaceae bacterium]|nr:hypothetical protein [Pseudobdellovibrionaceae bacterium]